MSEPTLHDRHARATLRLIGPDPDDWVVNRDGIDHNVVVVGGGQSGTAFAFGLRRAGIGKVSVIDGAAGAPQREGKRRARLPAADDHDIVIEAGTLDDPVLRVGADEAQCFACEMIGC